MDKSNDVLIEFAVCIPTLNAGSVWFNVLESVKNQSIEPRKKIIIDSGSVDETVQLAINYGFEVISIDKEDFNHGKARQQLVNYVKDVEMCVFLTQDAVLAVSSGFDKLIAAFNDPLVSIAYGRQLPVKNATPLEAHARLFNYPDISEKITITDAGRMGFKTFFCSNSFSAYRISVLNDLGGFPLDSIMGEDAIIAAKMLIAGFTKAYVSDALVYHSHNYSFAEEFKRYFDTRVFHEQNKWLIETFGKPTGEGVRFVKSEVRFALKNNPYYLLKSVSSSFAKWFGYKLAKFYQIIPLPLLKKLSMHKFYWK